jgi:UDP-glucose 4-epimerase
MKILVTGASGFIGSFLVDEALARGFEVWAGVRGSSSKAFLQDGRIRFINLDFDSRERLEEQLTAFAAEEGRWDYIIHAAGVTKCLDSADFMRVNFDGTKNFIESLAQHNMLPTRFLYLSSLSIYGPVREQQPYTPILDTDTPCPNTAYGRSKLAAEEFIKSFPGLEYVIFRPTGVYGPREKDYFKMVQSIASHVDFSVGYKPQVITFIYVKDLVKAIYMAIDKGVSKRCYFVSEPRGYDSRSFSDYIQAELGQRWVLHVKAPLWVLKAISTCAEYFARMTKQASTLNRDKYNIMKQRNWLCDTRPIEEELGFSIDYTLQQGTKEMIEWYKKEKWI